MERSEFWRRIAVDASRGEASFPTSVRAAMRVKRALDDPDCHLDQAARLLIAEPLLAAKVVALANSTALNPLGRQITNLRTAAARLGFGYLRMLAGAIIVRQLADARSAREREIADQLWEHTIHVSALAHVLARRVTGVNPETAMFAAVVHEVGGFYLISRSKDYPGLLDEDFSVWRETGEVDVGRAVLGVLQVPQTVIEAVAVCADGFLALPPATLGDTLLLADELAPVESPLRSLGDVAGAGAAASIEMIVGEQTLSEILAESSENVRSLVHALRL